jgi:hypothetical protein
MDNLFHPIPTHPTKHSHNLLPLLHTFTSDLEGKKLRIAIP